MSPPYENLAFQRKVTDALTAVERILAIEKKPLIAGDVDHTYGAKYELVNSVSNVAIIAYMNTLEKLGLDVGVLNAIDCDTPTTLCFDASTTCKFLEKKIVDVPLDTSCNETIETKSTGILGNTKTKRTSKVVQHIEEWHYKVETSWCVSIYSAADVAQKKVLKLRIGSTTLITQSKEMPLPKHKDHGPIELSLTWLMQQIDKTPQLTSNFRVNVEESTTKTPRRNTATQNAVDFADSMKVWCDSVSKFMSNKLESDISRRHNPAIPIEPKDKNSYLRNSFNLGKKIFNPVLPLMEDGEEDAQNDNGADIEHKSVLKLQSSSSEGYILSPRDITKLLNEHVRSMTTALATIKETFPPDTDDNIVANSEAYLSLCTAHLSNLCSNFLDSMAYVENLMETQLYNAIGKRITPDDLETFVKFHNARLLSPMPQPFSHAVRRPEHTPVGLVSIESSDKDHKCIHTHTRVVANAMLNMPLNAATMLELTGKQYLHGWLNHRFEKHHKDYKLVARARQFSAYILVVGTMTGPNSIEPLDAIIIQNKDEVMIPLLLNELPTAKEFKDAIKSLSPEQQSFARAYRSMQLQSSVFGCVVVQIKPQLEVLLGLPQNALDKEMKLTQDLMELFTEYQVPSDLLSYDGRSEGVALEDKLDNVRKNVKAVIDVIGGEKKKQMELAKARTDMAIEQKIQNMGENDAVEESVACFAHGGVPAASARRMRAAPMMMAMQSRSMAMDVSPLMSSASAESRSRLKQARAVTGRVSSARYSAKPDVRQLQQQQQQQQQRQTRIDSVRDFKGRTDLSSDIGTSMTKSDGVDFTLLPQLLDAAVEKTDEASALRSTIIKTGQSWLRNRQDNLLSGLNLKSLGADELKQETNKAKDLLDALSRSGSLAIESSELHVIVAVTHCFEKDIIGTIIQDNVNPIQKIEASTLLFASAIHGVDARELIKDESELNRLEGENPLLLKDSESIDEEDEFARLASC
eukprot:CAMPEP_0201685608 /NCGR_PEP_ID=MMETSP0578-20130828/318_1 /ASSEMBLY_ACC=CAM_ASM_000663 /TAXON_ID=267565 /ORGANISM="Skeletonema grethea, Strain CCMP 1804" /LENGTH=975 /DNA_ID=CAMNT_0048169541 /DNA_START=77 /DNA_END=3004 /DNA_ORIENTATION=-